MIRRAALLSTLALALAVAACQAPAGMAPAGPSADGRPAAGAPAVAVLTGAITAPAARGGYSLRVAGPGFAGESHVGEDGAYRLEVSAGGTYRLTAVGADADGRPLRATTLVDVPADVRAQAVPALAPGDVGAIHGRVVVAGDEGSGAAAGADVYLAEGMHVAGKVGADGTFDLTHVPAGSWTLLVQLPGRATHAVPGVHVLGRQATELAEPIALVPARPDAGGLAGRGRPGALVAVIPLDGAATRPGWHLAAVCGADGGFQVPDLPAGAYELHIQAGYHAADAAVRAAVKAGEVTDVGALGLTSRARHAGRVVGRVVDAFGDPVAGARVTATPGGATADSDAGGAFALDGLHPGDVAIAVAAPDHLPAMAEAHLRDRAGVEADLGTLIVRRADAPSAIGAATRPTRAGIALLPPRFTATAGADGLAVAWAHVPKPADVAEIVYDLEAADAAGRYRPIATTAESRHTLPAGAWTHVRVRARDRARAYDAAPAGYGLRALTAAMSGAWSAQFVGGRTQPCGFIGTCGSLPPVIRWPSPTPTPTPTPPPAGTAQTFGPAGDYRKLARALDGTIWGADFGAAPQMGRLRRFSRYGEARGTYDVGSYPIAVQVGAQGHCWVVSTNEVRKFGPDGDLQHSTPFFTNQTDAALAPDGALWLLHDADRGTMLQRFAPDGALDRAFRVDPGANLLSVDGAGNLFVGYNSEIKKYAPAGALLTTFGGFGGIQQIGFTPAGNMWVLNRNYGGSTGNIGLHAPDGRVLRAIIIDIEGMRDGLDVIAWAMAVDPAGNAWATYLAGTSWLVGYQEDGTRIAKYAVPRVTSASGSVAIDGWGDIWIGGFDGSVIKVAR